jgi:hypothetical protein
MGTYSPNQKLEADASYDPECYPLFRNDNGNPLIRGFQPYTTAYEQWSSARTPSYHHNRPKRRHCNRARRGSRDRYRQQTAERSGRTLDWNLGGTRTITREDVILPPLPSPPPSRPSRASPIQRSIIPPPSNRQQPTFNSHNSTPSHHKPTRRVSTSRKSSNNHRPSNNLDRRRPACLPARSRRRLSVSAVATPTAHRRRPRITEVSQKLTNSKRMRSIVCVPGRTGGGAAKSELKPQETNLSSCY